jgi:Uma2 family endonuclease
LGPANPGAVALRELVCHHHLVVDPARRPHYSFLEYLQVEQGSTIKHEFLDGEIFAMAGGTPEHAAVAANVIAALHRQLADTGCRVYSSDLRVRVSATGLTTYPDVTIVCGDRETDPRDANTVVNPTLIVEILSPSTAAYDRGEKLAHYQQIPSLREVVLVDHAEQRIELLRRTQDGFVRLEHRTREPLTLTAVAAELTLDAVYLGIV